MDFLGTPHDASRCRCLWCRGLTDVWLTGVAAQLGSENVDYSQEKAVIESGVESSMCGVNDNLASPMVLYSSILDQPWDKEYPSYVHVAMPALVLWFHPSNPPTPPRYTADNQWSNCWQGQATFHSDWREGNYKATVAFMDLTCRAGQPWYSTMPDSAQPCSWYRQMACVHGDD